MLTMMTDADWTTVLKVLEASRSRRGDKGRDDKSSPSALHCEKIERNYGSLVTLACAFHLDQIRPHGLRARVKKCAQHKKTKRRRYVHSRTIRP